MQSGSVRTRALGFILTCTALGVVALSGCKKVAAPTPGNTPPAADPTAGKSRPEPEADASDKFASAKATFKSQCVRCHSVSAPGGEGGGKMRGKGPNLAKVGADPKHTKTWLTDHINDPESHTEGSRMPKFAGKIKEAELKDLVNYLASLK